MREKQFENVYAGQELTSQQIFSCDNAKKNTSALSFETMILMLTKKRMLSTTLAWDNNGNGNITLTL